MNAKTPGLYEPEWELAAAVVRSAYEDYVKGLALMIYDKQPEYSENTRKERDYMFEMARRRAYKDLENGLRRSGTTYTEEDLEARAHACYKVMRAAIQRDFKTAEEFFKSGRAVLFSRAVDPKAYLDIGRQRVREWADGERESYMPEPASAQ